MAYISNCSIIDGQLTYFYEIASLMHKVNGYCFVDFDLSAPFVKIDMHPDKDKYLDGVFFTMKRFLSGSLSSTILLYNKNMSLLNQSSKS